MQGRIDFYGPVIVTGAVAIRGTGSDDVKFYGGVMAQDVTLDDSRLTGNATVNYSSCAIRRALQGSADAGSAGRAELGAAVQLGLEPTVSRHGGAAKSP